MIHLSLFVSLFVCIYCDVAKLPLGMSEQLYTKGFFFTVTAEILPGSLANFHCQ